jgi:hypothetical protein
MFNTLNTIITAQFIAPTLMFNVPNFTSLDVVEVSHEKGSWYEYGNLDDFERQMITDGFAYEDEFPSGVRIPDRTIISVYSFKTGRQEIILDEETSKVIYIGNKLIGGTTTFGGSGSADIGIALVGIPGIVAASPAIIINELLWKSVEKSTNMKRHAWSVWRRIKNQLDAHTYNLAEKAFLKYEW